jgi:hypothetical protein
MNRTLGCASCLHLASCELHLQNGAVLLSHTSANFCQTRISHVTSWRLQPLLCNTWINNVVIQPVSMQWIGKHAPAAGYTHVVELLLESVFSTWPLLRDYKGNNWGDAVNCQLLVQFCAEGSENRTWARELEESSL